MPVLPSDAHAAPSLPSLRAPDGDTSNHSRDYRVTHLLADLGWVDFDLGCSTGRWAAQARQLNIPNPSQPNPGPLGDGSPCTSHCLNDFCAIELPPWGRTPSSWDRIASRSPPAEWTSRGRAQSCRGSSCSSRRPPRPPRASPPVGPGRSRRPALQKSNIGG